MHISAYDIYLLNDDCIISKHVPLFLSPFICKQRDVKKPRSQTNGYAEVTKVDYQPCLGGQKRDLNVHIETALNAQASIVNDASNWLGECR